MAASAGGPHTGPWETCRRLLAALERAADEADRVGADEVREWAALAAMDAVDLGEELGMLYDVEGEARRQAIRARVEDLGHPV